MADETTSTETTTEETTSTTETVTEEFDKDRAMNTIKAQREELKQYREKTAAEMAALQAKLKEHEDSKLSDDERKEARIKELEARDAERSRELQTLGLKLQVHSLAGELSIADADLAIAALDTSKVRWSEDGTPENLRDMLEELLERKPILRGSPVGNSDDDGTDEAKTTRTASTNSGAGGGNTKPPALTADELEFAQKMGVSPEKYAANKELGSVEDYLARLKSTT